MAANLILEVKVVFLLSLIHINVAVLLTTVADMILDFFDHFLYAIFKFSCPFRFFFLSITNKFEHKEKDFSGFLIVHLVMLFHFIPIFTVVCCFSV